MATVCTCDLFNAEVAVASSGFGNSTPDWPDFWGHSQVTVQDDQALTTDTFDQIDSPGRLSHQVVQDRYSGATLRDLGTFWKADRLDSGAQGIIWTHRDSDDLKQEGGHKYTTYAYQTGNQNGAQYGNLTDTYDYDMVQNPNAWVRHVEHLFFPGAAADHYVVSRLALETIYAFDPGNPGGPGIRARQTLSCYDGAIAWNTPIGGAGTDGSYRARLTARRLNADLPNTDRYVDTTFGYDAYGNQVTQTRWNSYGNAAQLAASDGRTTTTAYDANYHAYKASVTTPPTPNVPGGLVTTYGYDTLRNRLTSVQDPNGQTTTHTYDPLGRRLATWRPGDDPSQPGAATVTYRYLIGGGSPTRIQVGQRKDLGDGSFGVRSYTWQHFDGTGKLLQTQTDYNRSTTHMQAQDINDLLTAIGNDGGTPPFSPVTGEVSHVAATYPTQLQSAVQSLWSTAGLGPLPIWSSNVTPGSGTPIYLSDLTDLRSWLNWYETSQGKAVHGWGNDAGSVIVTNRVYDARGLPQRESVPRALTLNAPGLFQAGDWSSTRVPSSTSTFDGLRRPLTRVQPDGSATYTWSYSGWTTTMVDENGHQKTRANDVLGRLVSVQDYLGTYPSASPLQTTSYAYDVGDSLTGVTDATGLNVTSLTYDSLGRLIQLTDPDLGSVTSTYNPIGTLASRTDANNQTINFTYDNLDRVASKTGPNLSVAYRYDEGGLANTKGRRSGMTDGAGTATYQYDARGRLSSLVRVINGDSYPLAMVSDEQDRLVWLSYPNGDVLQTWYGDDGLPATLWLNGNIGLVVGATHTPLGQPSTIPLGNGLVTQLHYYAIDISPPVANRWYGRLASIQTGGVQNQNVNSYDLIGNITGLSYADHTGETIAAADNELDQLVTFGGIEAYSYIPGGASYDIGTLQTKGSAAYTFPAPGQPRPHAPTWVTGVGSYGYDASGNRSNDVAAQYVYDSEDHLTQVVPAGHTVLQNTFDGDGQRLVRIANGLTTHFVGQWYEQNATTGVATAYYPFGGVSIAMKQGSTLSYLHHDHLGSLVSATDANRNELGWARYYPFGATRLSGGTLPSDRLFTGQTRDMGNDRLYWFKSRNLDATIGQFYSPDKALPEFSKGGPRDPQTLNRYAYALNNPLRLIDPSGHAAAVDPGGGSGDWVTAFQGQHGGRMPTAQDLQDRQFSLSHAGSGPAGTWTGADWALYGALQARIGLGLAQLGWGLAVGAERQVLGADDRFASPGSPFRPPDYTAITVGFSPPDPWTRGYLGVSVQLTRDRYGDWYVSPGVGVGKSPVVTGSVTGGWVLYPKLPSQQNLEGFITSLSLSGGAFWRSGGFQVVWGNLGTTQANAVSVEFGYSTSPQVGLSLSTGFEYYHQDQ